MLMTRTQLTRGLVSDGVVGTGTGGADVDEDAARGLVDDGDSGTVAVSAVERGLVDQ